MFSKVSVPAITVVVIGAALVALRAGTFSHAAPADVPAATPAVPDQIAALQAEVNRLKGIVPDQSHAMADVGLHYSNLWFAGEEENWPLAQFCFDETHSHLRWAIRIIPVRKNLKGEEIRLTEVFAAMEATNFKALGQTIAARDKKGFELAYRNMMDSCYACHVGADKPYLRLHIPERPALPILDFTPPRQ